MFAHLRQYLQKRHTFLLLDRLNNVALILGEKEEASTPSTISFFLSAAVFLEDLVTIYIGVQASNQVKLVNAVHVSDVLKYFASE